MNPHDRVSHSLTHKEKRVELHMQTNTPRADVHVNPGCQKTMGRLTAPGAHQSHWRIFRMYKISLKKN